MSAVATGHTPAHGADAGVPQVVRVCNPATLRGEYHVCGRSFLSSYDAHRFAARFAADGTLHTPLRKPAPNTRTLVGSATKRGSSGGASQADAAETGRHDTSARTPAGCRHLLASDADDILPSATLSACAVTMRDADGVPCFTPLPAATPDVLRSMRTVRIGVGTASHQPAYASLLVADWANPPLPSPSVRALPKAKAATTAPPLPARLSASDFVDGEQEWDGASDVLPGDVSMSSISSVDGRTAALATPPRARTLTAPVAARDARIPAGRASASGARAGREQTPPRPPSSSSAAFVTATPIRADVPPRAHTAAAPLPVERQLVSPNSAARRSVAVLPEPARKSSPATPLAARPRWERVLHGPSADAAAAVLRMGGRSSPSPPRPRSLREAASSNGAWLAAATHVETLRGEYAAALEAVRQHAQTALAQRDEEIQHLRAALARSGEWQHGEQDVEEHLSPEGVAFVDAWLAHSAVGGKAAHREDGVEEQQDIQLDVAAGVSGRQHIAATHWWHHASVADAAASAATQSDGAHGRRAENEGDAGTEEDDDDVFPHWVERVLQLPHIVASPPRSGLEDALPAVAAGAHTEAAQAPRARSQHGTASALWRSASPLLVGSTRTNGHAVGTSV